MRLFVLAVLAAPALLAGCSPDPAPSVALVEISQFQTQVLQARGPILVQFYKNPCPTCVVQEEVLRELAGQYAGRVSFARYQIADAMWNDTTGGIKQRYRLNWVPTTILFVNGQEKERWELNHLAGDFRPALDMAVLSQRRDVDNHAGRPTIAPRDTTRIP